MLPHSNTYNNTRIIYVLQVSFLREHVIIIRTIYVLQVSFVRRHMLPHYNTIHHVKGRQVHPVKTQRFGYVRDPHSYDMAFPQVLKKSLFRVCAAMLNFFSWEGYLLVFICRFLCTCVCVYVCVCVCVCAHTHTRFECD